VWFRRLGRFCFVLALMTTGLQHPSGGQPGVPPRFFHFPAEVPKVWSELLLLKSSPSDSEPVFLGFTASGDLFAGPDTLRFCSFSYVALARRFSVSVRFKMVSVVFRRPFSDFYKRLRVRVSARRLPFFPSSSSFPSP